MDTETQVAEQLREKLPKPEFRDNEQPKPTPKPENDGSHNNLPLENMVLKQQMFDFLDIPVAARQDPDTANSIDAILEWAHQQTGSREFGDLLKVINRQEGIMGSRLSADRFARLYKYVKISRQMDSLEEQMRALYG